MGGAGDAVAFQHPSPHGAVTVWRNQHYIGADRFARRRQIDGGHSGIGVGGPDCPQNKVAHGWRAGGKLVTLRRQIFRRKEKTAAAVHPGNELLAGGDIGGRHPQGVAVRRAARHRSAVLLHHPALDKSVAPQDDGKVHLLAVEQHH